MFWRRKPAEVDLDARREKPPPRVIDFNLQPNDMVVLYRRNKLGANELRNQLNGVRRALKSAGHESVRVFELEQDEQVAVPLEGDGQLE